jgi:hypothetical protein
MPPSRQSLLHQQMVGGTDINPSTRQPTPKPSLVRLGKLSTTRNIHAKPIEMNVLTLDDADDHPAERSQMTDILPLHLALTQISRQRIIKTGSRSH